jgi:membrane fusion protein, multidrug efflux system
MRNVNVLRTWGSNSVIGSGLEPGEVVISEGQMRLMPGATVQVLKPQSAKSSPAAANAAGL